MTTSTASSSFFAIRDKDRAQFKERIRKYMRPFIQEMNRN